MIIHVVNAIAVNAKPEVIVHLRPILEAKIPPTTKPNTEPTPPTMTFIMLEEDEQCKW